MGDILFVERTGVRGLGGKIFNEEQTDKGIKADEFDEFSNNSAIITNKVNAEFSLIKKINKHISGKTQCCQM